MAKIPVLLVDEHVLVREGLRALLETEEDMEVVGEAASDRQAVRLARKSPSAVIVMDVTMPLRNSVEATRRILRAQPSARVLAFSSYRGDEHVRRIMRAGAAGYLLKQTAAGELPRAIREVHRGNAYFSSSVAKRLREACRQASQAGLPRGRVAVLSSRQREVLQLIAEGLPNKDIAAELGISPKTVEKHRQQVMKKLDIHDTAGLTRYALSRGWVELGQPASV